MKYLKKLIHRLPPLFQSELKRLLYGYQIRTERFITEEPEYLLLPHLLSYGDWAIDIGANIGHYAKKISDLVGPKGRVIAIEPVPDTFKILAANVSLFKYRNVTLLNVAASDHTSVAGMCIPCNITGEKNYYEARLTICDAEFQVLTLALSSLSICHKIKLIKIDTEGHDGTVLKGLEGILLRDSPTLIVETSSQEISEYLKIRGYSYEKLPGSPNTVYRSSSEKKA